MDNNVFFKNHKLRQSLLMIQMTMTLYFQYFCIFSYFIYNTYLFTILPIGVVSKNDIGHLKVLCSKLSCNDMDALTEHQANNKFSIHIKIPWDTPITPYTIKYRSRSGTVILVSELHLANHMRELIRKPSAQKPKKNTSIVDIIPRLFA